MTPGGGGSHAGRPSAPERAGYVCERFPAEGMLHDVWSKGSGPPVIVLHELPGVDRRTIALAELVRSAGFRVVVPVLVGSAIDRSSTSDFVVNTVRICVSREIVAFRQGRTSRVVRWLLALAARESAAVGGGPIGVIGMCLTGGFALAMAVDPSVAVAVASQPSLPFAVGPLVRVPGQAHDLGLSDADLREVAARRDPATACIVALRYSDDRIAPRARFERLVEELGPGTILVEIPSRDPTDHPVLTDAAIEGPEHHAWPAFEAALGALRERLLGTADRPGAA
ncbi:MAG TPA: dienelactone hydrolase family protein [Candidatus Limnocylindrales bacterium]|nr:dienelactone hydrolase family protein [Candidatus Limnocylindrales bacterium]